MFTPKKYSEDDIFACYRTRVVYLNEFDFGPLYTEEPFLASLVELTRHPDLQAKIKTGSNRKKLSEGKDRHAIDTAIMRKEKLDLQEKLKKEETASVTSKSDSKQSEKFASSEDENKSSDKFKGKSASQSSLQIIDDQEANNQPIDEGNKTSNTTQDKYSSAYYPNIRVEKVQKYKPVPISHDDVINEQKFDEKGNLKYTIKTYKLGTSLQREQKTLIPTMQQKKPEKIQEKIQEIIPPKPRPKIDMTKDSLMPDFVPTRLVDSISSLTPDTRIMVNDPFEGIHMPKRTNRAPLSIFMPKKNLPPSAARNNLINNNNQEEIEVQKPQQKPIKAEKKGPENNRPATLVVHNKETNKIQIINNPKVQEQKPEKKLTHQQLKQQIAKTQTKTINNATKNVQKQKSSEQETIPEPDSIKESIKEPESIKESLKEPESIKESIKEPESVKEPEPEPEPVRILEIEPDPDLVNNGKKSGKKKKMSAAQKKLLKKLQRKNQTKEFEEEEEYNPYEAPRPFIPDIPDEMRSETEIRSNPPAPPKIEPIVETYKPLIQQLQDDDQISEQFLEQDEQINNNINYQEQKEEPINVSDHYKEPEEQKQISQPEIIENNAEYTEIPTKKVQTKILNNSQFIIPQQPAPESVPTVQQRSVITLRKVIKLKKVYRGDQVIDVKQEVISSIPANVAKTKLLSKSETEKRRQEQLQELKKLYDQTTTVAPVITTNETEEIPKKQEDINQLLTDRKSKRSKPSPPRQQQPKQQQQQYVWNDFTYDQNDENDEENEEDDLDLDNLDLPMMAALQNHQQNKAKTEKKKAEMAAKGVERFDEVDIAGMHLTFAPRKADHSVYYGVDIRNLGPDFTPSNIKITKPLKLHGPDIEHILESRKEKLASIMIPKEYLKDRTDTPEIASLKREIRKKLREAALEQRTYKSAWDINADFVREMGRSKEVDHKQINNLKYTAYPQGFGYTPPQEKQNNAGENQTESWEDYDFGWGTKVQGNFGSFDKIMENERLNPTDKIKVVQQTDTSILDELDFGPKPHVERKVAIKILGPAVDPEEQKIQERRKEFKIVPKRAEYKQRMEEAERNKPDTTMFNNLMAEEAENAKKKQSKIRYSPEKTRPSEFDLLMQDEANKTQSKVSTLRPKQKTIWDSVTVQADPVEKTEEEVPGGKTWGLTFKPKPAEKQKAPLRPSLRDDGDDYYGQTRKSFFESLMEEEKAKADAEKAARKSRTQQTKGVLMGRNDFNSLLQEEERKANEPEEETIVDLNETEHIPPNPMNNAPKLIENDEMFWGVEEQYDTNLIGEEAKQQNDQKSSDQKQSVSEVFEEPKQIASEKEEKPSRRERKRRGKSKESPKNEPQNIPAPKQQQQSSSGWDSLSAFQESDPMAGVTNLKYTRLTKAQRAKLNAESVLKTVAFRSKSLAARSSYRAPDYLPDGKEMPVLYEPSNQTWGTLEIDIPEEERIKAMKEKNRLMKVVKIDDDDVTEWGTKRKHNPIDFNLIEKTEIDQSSAKRRARSSNHVTFVGEVTFEPEKKKPKFVAPTIDEIATELPKLEEEEEVNVEKWVNGVLGEDKTKEKEEDKKKYPIEEFSKQKRSASAAPSSAFDDPSNWGAAGNEDEMVFVGLTYKPKKFYDIREIQKQEEEKKKQMYHKIKRSKNKQAVDTSALDFSPSTKNRSQYEAPTVDSDFDEPEPYVEKAPERIQAFPEEIEKPIEKFEKPVEKFEKPIEKRPQKQTEKVPEKIEKPIENPYPLQKEESIDLDEIDLSDEEQLIKAALNYKPKPVEKKKKKVDLPTPSKWMSFDFDSLLAEPDEKKRSQSVQPVSTKQRIAALKANQNQPEFQPKQTKSKYEAPSILAEEEPKQEEFDDSWYEINDPHHVPFSGPRNKQQEKKEQQFDQILKEEKTKKEEATNLSFKPKETKSKYEAPDVVSDEEIKPKKKSTPVYRKFSDEDEDKEQKQEEKEKDEWDNVDNEFGEDLEVDGLKYEPKKQEKKESEFDKILKEEKTKHEEATNLSFKPKEKASKYEAPEVISDEEKEILPKRKPEFRKFSDDESEEDNKEQKKEEVNEWDNAKDGFTEELEIDGLKYEPKKQEKKESELDKLLQEEKTKHEEATNLSFKPKEKASKYEAPEVISDEEKEILPKRKPEFRKFSDDESEEEKEEEKPQLEKSEWEAANDGFTEDLEVDGLKYEPKKQEKKESEFDKIMKEEKAKHEEATNVSFKPKEKSSKYEAPEVVPERKFGPKKKSTPIYRKFSDEDEEEEQKQQEIKEEKEKDEWDNVDNEFGEDLEVDGLKYEPKKKEKKPSEFELILLDEQTKKDDQIRVKRSRSPAKTAELPSFKPKETASKYEAPEIVSDQEKIQSSKGSIVSDHKTTETDEWNHVNDEFGEELEFSGMKYEPKKKEEEKKPEEFEKLLEEEKQKRFESVSEEFVQEEQPKKSKRSRSPTKAAVELPSFKPKETSTKYDAPEVVSDQEKQKSENEVDVEKWVNNVLGSEKETEKDKEETTPVSTEEEKPKDEWEAAAGDNFDEDIDIYGLKYEPKQKKQGTEFNKLIEEEKQKKEVKVEEQKPETEESPKKAKRARSPAKATELPTFKPKETSAKFDAPEIVSDQEKPEQIPNEEIKEEIKEEEPIPVVAEEEKPKDEWEAAAEDNFDEDIDIYGLKYEPRPKKVQQKKQGTEFNKLIEEEKQKKEIKEEKQKPISQEIAKEESPKKARRARSPVKATELPSFKPKEIDSKFDAPEIASDQEKPEEQEVKAEVKEETKEEEPTPVATEEEKPKDEWEAAAEDNFDEDIDIYGLKYEPKPKPKKEKANFEKLLEEEKQKKEVKVVEQKPVSQEIVKEESPKKARRARSPAKATELPSFKPKETSTKYDAPEVVSDQEKQKSEDEVDVEKWVNNVLDSEKETEKDKEGTTPVSTEEEKPKDEWEAAAGDNFDEDIDIYGLKYEPKQKPKKDKAEFNKLIEEEKQKEEESPKKVKRGRSPAKMVEKPEFKPKEKESKIEAPEATEEQIHTKAPEEEEEEEIDLNDVLELQNQVVSNDDWDNLDNFIEDDIEIEGLKYQPKKKEQKKQEFNKLIEEEKAHSGQTEAVLENTTFKPKEKKSKSEAPSIDQVKKEKKSPQIKDFNEIQPEEEEKVEQTVKEEVVDEWNNNETFTEEMEIDGLKYEPKQKSKKVEMKHSDEFNKLIEEENKAEKLKEQQLKPAFTPKSKQHKYDAPEIVNDQKESKKPVYKDFVSDEEQKQEDQKEIKEEKVKDEWEDIHEEFQEENYPIDGLKYVPKTTKISPENIVPSDEPKISDFDRIMMQEEKKRSSSPQPVSFQKKKQQQTKVTIDLPSFKPSTTKKSNYEAPEVTDEQIKVEEKGKPVQKEEIEVVEEKQVDEWNETTFDEGMDYDGLRYIPKQQHSVEKPSKQKTEVKFTEKPKQQQKEQKKEFNAWNAAAGEFAGDEEEKKESNYVVKPIDIKPKQIRSTSPSARQGKKLFEELLDEEKKLHEKELEEKQKKQKEMKQKAEIHPRFTEDFDEFPEEEESSRAKIPIDISKIVKSPTYLSQKKTIIKDLFPPGFEPGSFEQELPPGYEEQTKPIQPEQIINKEQPKKEEKVKPLQPEQIVATEKKEKEQPTKKEEVQPKKAEKVPQKPVEKVVKEQPTKKEEIKPVKTEKVSPKPVKEEVKPKEQPIKKAKEEVKQEKVIKEQPKKEEKPISSDLSKLQKFIIKNEKIIDNESKEKKKRSVSPPPFAVRAKPTKKKVIKTKEILQELQTITKKKQTKPEKKKEEPKLPEKVPEEDVHAKVPLPLKSLPDDFDLLISSDQSSNMLISDSDLELPDNLFGNDSQLFKESSGSDDKFSDGPMFESSDELPMTLLDNVQQIKKHESKDNIKEQEEEEKDDADNEDWTLENDDDMSPFEFEKKSSPEQKEKESSNSMEEEEIEVVETKKVPVLVQEEVEIVEESKLLANNVIERVKKSANKKRSSSPQPVSFQKTKKFLESKEIVVPLQQTKKQQNIPVEEQITFEEQPKTEIKPIEPSQFMTDESQVSEPPKQVEEEIVKTPLEEIKQSMKKLTEKPSKKQTKPSKTSQPSFKPKSQTKKMEEPEVQEEQIKPIEKPEKPVEKVPEKQTKNEEKPQKVTEKPIEKVTEKVEEKVEEKPKQSESAWNMDSDDWGAAEFAEDDIFFGTGLVYKPNPNSNKQENKAKTNKKSAYVKSKSSFDTLYDDEAYLEKSRKDKEEATRIRDIFDEVDQLTAKKPTKSSVEIPDIFLTKKDEIAYKNKHGAVEVFDDSVDVINGFWGPIRVQPQTKTTFDIIDEEEKTKEEKVKINRQKQRSRSAAPTSLGFTPKKTTTYQPPEYVPPNEDKKEIKQKKSSIREMPDISPEELDEIMSVEIPERKDYKIERYDSWEAAENNIFNEEDDISIIGRKYTPIEIKLNPARSRSLSKSDTNEMKFTAPILGKFVTTTFNEIMTEEQKINSFNHSKYTQRSKSVMPTRRRKRDPTEPIPEVEFSPSHKSFIEAPTYESDQEQPPEPKPKEIKDKFLEEEQQPEPQITWKVDSWDDFKSDQFNEDEDLILMPTFYHPKPDAPKFQVAKRERKTQSRSKSEKPPRKLKSDAIEKADQVLRDHQNVIKLAEKQQQQTQTQTKTKPTESDIRVYDESTKSLGQDWGEKPKQTTTMNFDSLVAEENEKEKIKDAAIKVDFEPHTFVPKYEPPTYDETAPVLPPEEKSDEEKTIEIKYEEDSAEFDPMGVKAKVREYHDDIDNWKATDDILEDVMIGRQYTPRKNDEYIQQFWDETKRAKVQSQRAKSELPRANKRDKSKDKDKLVHVADPNIELKWHVDPTKVVNNMDTDFSKIMESEQIKAENEEKSEKAKMVIDLDEEQASEKVTKMIYRRKEKKEKYVPLNDEEIKEFEEAIKPINERATVSRISAQRKSRPVLEPFTESIEFTPEPIDPVTSTAPDYPYLAEDEENYKKEKIEEDKKQMDEKLGKLEAEHKKEEMKKEFLKSKFFEEFNEWENASKLIFVEDPPPGLVMQQFVSKFEEYKPINVSKKQQPDQPSPNRRQIRGPVKRGKVQVEEPEIELSFYDAPEEKEEPKSVVIKAPVLKIGGKNGPLQLPAKFLPPAVKIGRKKQVDQPAKENVSEKQTNISAAHSVLDGIINPVPEPAQEQTEEPIIPVTKLDEPIIGPKVNLFSPQKFERTDLKPVEKSNSIEESKPVKELTVVKKNPTRKVKQQVQEPVPIVVKTEEKPNIEIPQEKQVVPKKPGVIGAPTISFDELMKREEKVAKGEEKEENIDIGWVQQQLPKSIPTVSVSKWVKPKRVQPQEEEKQRKPSPKKSQKKKQKNEENNQQKLRFKPIMPLPIKRNEPVTDTSTYTRPVPMVEPKATTTFFPATLKYINEDGKLVVENMFSVPQPPKKPSLSIRRTKAGTTEVETTVFTPKEEEEKKEVEQEIKQPENVEQVEEEKNEVPTVELPEKEKLSVGKKPEEFDLKKWARNDELMHNEGVEEEEIPDVTKIVPEKPKEEENIPNFWLDEVSPEEVALVEKEEEERKKQQEMQQPKPEEIETSLPEGIKPVERPQTEEQIPTFEELEGKKPEEVSTPTEEAVEEKKPEETKVSEEEKKIEETISEVKPEEQKPTEEETVKEEKVEETIKPAEEEKKEEVSVAEKEEPTKVEEEKPKTEETVKPEEEKPVEEKKEEIKETPKTEEVKEEQKPTEEEKEEKKEEAVKPEESKKEEKKEEQGKEEEEYEYEYVYEEEDVPEKEEEKGPSPEELMENFRKEAFKRAEERKRIEAEEEKKREEERKIRRMQQLEKEREEAIKREEEKKRQKELEELREFEMANEERTISENEALAAELQKGPMTEERSRMLAFQRERMRRKQFKEEVMEEEAADRRKQKKRQEEEERRRVREERLKIKRMMEQQEREQMRASFSAVDRKVNALFNSKARVLEAEEKLKQQKEEKLTQQRAERDAQIKQRQAILQAELERRRLADFERFTPKNKKKQMMEQLAKAAEEQRLREIQEEEERRRKEEEEIRRSKMTEEEKRKEKELEEQKKREEKKLREEQRRRQYEEEQKRLQEEQRRKQEAILEEKRKAAEEMRRKFEEKMKEKEEEQRRAEEMRKKAEEVMEKIIENQDKQEAVIIDAHEEEIRRLQELADKKLEAKMRKRQRRQAKYGKRRNEDDALFESTSSSDEEEEQAEEEKHETTEEQKKKENEEIPTWNTENEEKKDLKIIPAKYTEKKARNVIDIIDPTSQWTYDDLTEQETKNSQQSFFSRLLLEEESLLKAKQKQKSNEPKDEMAAKMGDFDEIETGTFTWQSAKKDPTRDELRNVFQRISAKNTRKKSPQKKGVGYMQRLSQSESRQILSKPNKDKVLVLSALLRANVADINWDEFVESTYGRSREDIVYALMSVTSKANAESITAKFIEKFK